MCDNKALDQSIVMISVESILARIELATGSYLLSSNAADDDDHHHDDDHDDNGDDDDDDEYVLL